MLPLVKMCSRSKLPSVKNDVDQIAVGEKYRRSKWPSIKNSVGQKFRRSKWPSVKIAVGKNFRRSKWPSVNKPGTWK
jgi:hypothetical protein